MKEAIVTINVFKMMTEPAKVSNLLSSVRSILSHQKEVERLKGEKFNVFSILKMESQENGTHSAFLGELLNPRGSHLKDSTFLKLFLEIVDMHQHIDADSAHVHLERYIGPRDDEAKTGGRVDIYIIDAKGNTLCIENKIYAGDQYAQVERYCNHNKEKNNVLYLTLTGYEPGAESKGCLVNGEDYYNISYRDDITAWLDLCIKESADLPIVRETIKQYKLLLKKMTTQIDNQHEKELVDLLLSNYEEASYVANNLIKAKRSIQEQVRQAVMQKLATALQDEFVIHRGSPIENRYAQVWIKYKAYPDSTLYFGVESFNGDGNFNGDLFVGVFNDGGRENSYTRERTTDKLRWWYDERFFETGGSRINLGIPALILKLHATPSFKEELIDLIVTETVSFVTEHKAQLLRHLQS